MPVRGRLTAIAFFLSLVYGTNLLAAPLSYTAPNDPYYTDQTHLTSSAPPSHPVSDVWKIRSDASSVVVAVIDTGADMTHPDLVDNLWLNSYEIPDNGIDDDGNGYVDDVHGYDFRHHAAVPYDEWGHGSLIAGIIGASGDNKIGIAGVAWNVQLMILKIFGTPEEHGSRLSDTVEAIRYAVNNGAQVINCSWRILSSPEDQIPSLMSAIEEARDAGVLVVTAAGNDGLDIDKTPVYPAAYDFDNVVSVAALTEKGTALLGGSNYGASRVTVATRGEAVIGTYLKGSYATLTGTSSAAAAVGGLAALILAQKPTLTPKQVKEIMVSMSEAYQPISSSIRAGGVLDFHSSLEAALTVQGTSASTAGSSSADSTSSTESTPTVQDSFGGTSGCSLIIP